MTINLSKTSQFVYLMDPQEEENQSHQTSARTCLDYYSEKLL